MKNTNTAGPSQRQLKVGEEIRHVVGRMLSQDDLFIEGLKAAYVMITEVRISPDLSYATLFVRCVGSVDTAEQVSILNAHKGPFRYRIGKTIRLRIVPDILFKADTSFDDSEHITELLNRPVVRDDIENSKKRALAELNEEMPMSGEE